MSETDATPDPEPGDDLIARFLASDGRGRKALLKEILPTADEAAARRLAPALRDPSPRVAARITALLARFGLEDELERQLLGLKPGKITLLRQHFRRIRGE